MKDFPSSDTLSHRSPFIENAPRLMAVNSFGWLSLWNGGSEKGGTEQSGTKRRAAVDERGASDSIARVARRDTRGGGNGA
jgi:hypothetical protein